ncbi:MAG: hypothetical protein M3292_01010 [Actinomycetota bacterium]|nr:hypothetical protein [Actinomycetota bacterium]
MAHLLRRSYREGGKVKNETVGNLSHLPEEVIELIRGALRGQRFVAAEEAFQVERSLPAGHVEAARSRSMRFPPELTESLVQAVAKRRTRSPRRANERRCSGQSADPRNRRLHMLNRLRY